VTAEHVAVLPLGRAAALVAADGLEVPRYDRSAVRPGIVHFGVGGFHRAHQAMYLDSLMNDGLAHDWGIVGVGLLPADERMRDVLGAQDGLYTLVVKAADGSTSARVVGSIVRYLYAPDAPAAVLDALVDPAVRIVTLTVTEGGYNVHRVTGEFDPDGPGIAHDLAAPAEPRTVFGFVVEALARRRAAGVEPFAVVSCDNVQGNGHVTREAFTGFARLRDPELAGWIDGHVPFPNSMVDRITPATTVEDVALVRERYGIADGWPVVCEPFTQWVLEDSFALGRPPLEGAGVQVVDDVAPYELMKLRLLNASHQALAHAGYLAGYRYVHEATADPAFSTFIRRYMREEAVPSLQPVPGVDLDAYVEGLVERFANPEIRDTLARVAVDASERIPKFLLPVIRFQLAAGGPIECGVAVLACWARYAEGVDEAGEPIEIVDPARDALTAAARRQRAEPLAFVQNRDVFGDLAEDPRFAAAYERALSAVQEHGARATVEIFARER
jgi:mannitol 2-dehydrogenase